MDELRQEISAVQTDGGTALAVAAGPHLSGAPEGGATPVTADSFRQLAARLGSKAAVAPVIPDNVIPLRKLTPRVAEPSSEPKAQAEPRPEPTLDILAPAPRRDRGEEAGDRAITLLELMAAATGLLPQERGLAADTLLLLLPRMPLPQMIRLAERVAIMDNPPPLLVEQLIRDPRPEIMGPVLERSPNICDRDMIAAAPLTDVERLRMIARRRVLSPVLSGHLAASGDPGVILALLRNTGAELPHQCFAALCALAGEHPVLLAPLATRAELPPEAAFELYWGLPPELRRLMLSRFLTDSGMLGRILRIARAEDAGLPGDVPRGEEAILPDVLDAALVEGLETGSPAKLARFAGIAEATLRRILADPQGEPAAVLLKALGVGRARFVTAMVKIRAAGLMAHSDPTDLQAVFDGLSFTKARMLLTYWDWFTRKAGPYAQWGEARPVPLVETVDLA